ncbi:hypothetical protein DFJ74DRAFT_707877 [Hyaloraphidium curvatum]|nr:hypothetical protein DFJ74DRAFT_707877 [Hyaloraphidium curvatum]
MSSVQAESRPDLAELKKAVQKKLRARGELRNDRPRPFSPEGAPPQTPDAAVAQLIREKDELLAALDEQRARADGLQAEAAAARAQPSPPGNADKERELLDENEALKRTIGSLTGRVSELEVTAAAAGQAGEKLAALLLERERDAASLAAHAEAERTARDALADLERRLGDATRQVEALNNEAVGLRENVAAARQERDEANERSLMLEKSIEMLETKVRNLTVREDLALTWKSKTEKLASENNRLLEERSELQGKLAELASSNASLTLALDTAQRHLAAQTDSPDPWTRSRASS